MKEGPRAGFRPWPAPDERPVCCEPVPYISTEDLSLHYGNVPAYEKVTLTINTGCITALVGPSGCGKTSFLSTLNRLTDLVPGARVTGALRVGEFDVLSPGIDVIQLRRRVGMIFQNPNPFPLSIWKNLAFPLKQHGIRERGQIAQMVESTLQDVGLWDEVKDRLDASALSLSGGQQQRLCLARALALSPDVLLLDEPCSALDPLSSGVVEDLIARLRGRFTVVIVTHNLAQARRIADYAALFWMQEGSGRLVESGPVKQFFEAPREALTAAYINGVRG